jgi:hypothetical protein
MSVNILRLIVAFEVGIALFLTLRIRNVNKPSMAVKAFGIIAILLGTFLLYQSHLSWGWLGPLGSLSYLPKRVLFLRSQSSAAVDFWDIFNPTYYLGILGLFFLVGGGGVVKLLSWARRILLWGSSIYITFYVVRLSSSSFSLPADGPIVYVIVMILAASFLVFFTLQTVKKQFVK